MKALAQRVGRDLHVNHSSAIGFYYSLLGSIAHAGVGVPEVLHLSNLACRRVGFHQGIPHGR